MAIAWRCMRGAEAHTCLRLHALQWRTTLSDYGNRYYHAQPTFPNFQDEGWGDVSQAAVHAPYTVLWTELHCKLFISVTSLLILTLCLSIYSYHNQSQLSHYIVTLLYICSVFTSVSLSFVCTQRRPSWSKCCSITLYTVLCSMLNIISDSNFTIGAASHCKVQ